MKKLMMICGLLLGVIGFAQAQQGEGRPGGGPGGRMGMNPEARVKQLDEKLKLSDDQKTKLTAIFTEQGEAQKKLREEGQGGDRQAMMEKMQKMRTDVETKINAVLNDEQKKTYKAMLDEQKAEMEKRMKERQGGNN
jgi:periplasmic protein CpxP/Spy